MSNPISEKATQVAFVWSARHEGTPATVVVFETQETFTVTAVDGKVAVIRDSAGERACDDENMPTTTAG
jgi:hypothetical protein